MSPPQPRLHTSTPAATSTPSIAFCTRSAFPSFACGGIAAILGPRVVGVSRRMAFTGVAGGWILLFVGHAIEGNRPAILGNPKAALDALRWWRRGAGRFARRMLPVALHPPNDVAQR